jgi:predicted N-acetyltransferase YhbS
MNIRLAAQNDHDSIFMMGYDVWSEGVDELAYLDRCRTSPKYAKGIWYVAEDKGQLLSSLIVYEISDCIYGIGSIATSPRLRKSGFASWLIKDVIDILAKRSDNSSVIFLYSDINPKFYERFQFCPVPDKFQNHLPSVCMVRPTEEVKKIVTCTVKVPSYF